jgi:hypothetical protein
VTLACETAWRRARFERCRRLIEPATTNCCRDRVVAASPRARFGARTATGDHAYHRPSRNTRRMRARTPALPGETGVAPGFAIQIDEYSIFERVLVSVAQASSPASSVLPFFQSASLGARASRPHLLHSSPAVDSSWERGRLARIFCVPGRAADSSWERGRLARIFCVPARATDGISCPRMPRTR